MRGGGTGDNDPVADADRTRITCKGLPATAAVDGPAICEAAHRSARPDGRHRGEVVTQVAGRGEKRRPAVLVATVTGQAFGVGKGLCQQRAVFVIQREIEQLQVVRTVLRFTEAGAHDHGRHGRLLEYPAARDVRHRYAVLRTNLARHPQHALQRVPAAHGMDETLVFHLAPVADVIGLGGADPAFAEEAAAQHAIGQQAHAALQAQARHVFGRTPVQQRNADLIAGDGNAFAEQHPQVSGVEVGQAQMRDQPVLPQARQLQHGIDVS